MKFPWLVSVLFLNIIVSTFAINLFSYDKVPYIEDLESKLPHHSIPEGSYKKFSPIIFVPGCGGSRLDAMLNKPDIVRFYCSRKTNMFFDIWLNKDMLIPGSINCFVDNMRLVYNNVTRKTDNSPGVTIRVPGWGYSETVEWIGTSHASVSAYYVNLANAMTANGYLKGRTLRGAPYDFRKAPNEAHMFRVKLKLLVEEAYLLNANTPVTLIVHSLGGPMTLQFLHEQTQEWKDKYIRRMISLSGAWGGSMKSMKVYAVGDDLGYWAVSSTAIRGIQVSTASLAFLMPSPLFWKPHELLATTTSRVYTVADLKDYFQDLDLSYAWEIYQDVLPYVMNFTAPGVEVHCYYGSGKDTVERLDWSSEDLSGTPTQVMGDGDGTVNLRSLQACKHWIGEQKQPVYVKEFPGIDHMGILANLKVLDAIVTLQLKDLK